MRARLAPKGSELFRCLVLFSGQDVSRCCRKTFLRVEKHINALETRLSATQYVVDLRGECAICRA